MKERLARILAVIDEVHAYAFYLGRLEHADADVAKAEDNLEEAGDRIRRDEDDISKISLEKVNILIRSARTHLEDYQVKSGDKGMIPAWLKVLKEAEELSDEMPEELIEEPVELMEEPEEPMEEEVDLLRVTDKEVIFSEPIVDYASPEEIEELWTICQRIGQRYKEKNADK